MVVDDNGNNLMLEKDLLEVAGFEVFGAENASSGITIAKREKPDIIVMDMRLPDMRGSEAAKALRLDKETRNIPIVFVTASVMAEGKEEINSIPNCGFIGKPINSRTFAKEISQFITKEIKDKPVILVVDDKIQNIELLEVYLVPQGYEIIKATSGEKALLKLSVHPIDLILMDVVMPAMDGFEVTRTLKQDDKTRLIPIILVTALHETEDRVKGIEAGCDDFISKPVDKMELLAKVDSLLRTKSLHDKVSEAREYAESIINTVRESLIILDKDLRVVTVSRSFYDIFRVKPEETVGQHIYDLGNKQWDIPKLRELLETILPQKTTFDDFEVEHDFTIIGRRTMLLNARQTQRALGKELIILLAIEDITERKRTEEALAEGAKEREKLIKELQYALDNIKTLQGLIPICANCKKIRDDKGFWNQVEGYIMAHSDATFTHGVCPECAKKLYGDHYDQTIKNLQKKNI
ncbi:MAG: response regulator [Bacteriovoracaceae bacterium]|nr:response regulator [Bacteroidota bacterium]